MTDKNCKKCKAKLNVVSVEAINEIHVHEVCSNIDYHPYFCRNAKRWIGK